MATCTRCGRSGFFLKLKDGLCDNCQSVALAEQAKEEIAKKTEQLKQELENSSALYEKLKDEARRAVEKELADQIEAFDKDIEKRKANIEALKVEAKNTNEEVRKLHEQVVETNETILLQSFGLYTPRYSFTNSDEYKVRLLKIRADQKDAIKKGLAVDGSKEWNVNGDVRKGRKMVADMQKLLLRAFNAECDDVIEHVKYNNIEASEKRITSSRDAISKLGNIMEISITSYYYSLKVEELYLAFEYAQKKQEEKEAQKEARAEMREATKVAKEIEEARKKLEKEQTHYQTALHKINEQLALASGDNRTAIEEKKCQIEAQLSKIDKEFADVDYREANQRAGYVYVISNIGAFGEGVYKIGMTRRLEPMERVDELGSASVPFNFDVHAMIFSDDAPKLEAALHNAFADRKVNFVNQRREFFRVSLDEIKKVVRENYDKTVEFVDVPSAEQYRQSILLREIAAKGKGKE